MSFKEKLQELRDQKLDIEKEITETLEGMGGICEPSPTNICGRTFASAPNPWMAIDGPCAGYSTLEAVEGRCALPPRPSLCATSNARRPLPAVFVLIGDRR